MFHLPRASLAESRRVDELSPWVEAGVEHRDEEKAVIDKYNDLLYNMDIIQIASVKNKNISDGYEYVPAYSLNVPPRG